MDNALAVFCSTCGVIREGCICAMEERHLPDCRFLRAARLSVELACCHGLQACPLCDPCNCVFYRVRTYDMDSGEFTPQDGVPEFVAGQLGLRKAISILRDMGYPANRSCGDSDPSVLIERVAPVTKGIR